MKNNKTKKYRIFISHSWSYDEYNKIIRFLNEEKFPYSNYSVPLEKAINTNKETGLKKSLKSRIKLSQIVIISAGLEINYREFIQYELKIAVEMQKPIIGIIPRGQIYLPKSITNNAWDIVGWNRNSIIRAIENYSL